MVAVAAGGLTFAATALPASAEPSVSADESTKDVRLALKPPSSGSRSRRSTVSWPSSRPACSRRCGAPSSPRRRPGLHPLRLVAGPPLRGSPRRSLISRAISEVPTPAHGFRSPGADDTDPWLPVDFARER
ncbi:hypothetical protein [Tsukamurella sp. 1534]|uniref:hypothetical protein n=1 Tax=Tsukamurella sp. 1534 TaxID=1151061 RepID=UPI000592C47E|nr:hypothetical protein [Tsukamurella sp. 1534]